PDELHRRTRSAASSGFPCDQQARTHSEDRVMTVLYGRTRRWLLLAAVLVTAGACRDTVSPREMRVPIDPSKEINDGANLGNTDVFFLPPLVPNPVGAAGYG